MTGADCYYGVTMVDPTALCCFRGTSTLPDLLRALEFTARVPPPSKQFNTAALGPVHPGAWQGLEEALASVVKDHHWSDIQFTGHSQGAMRATLATAAFAATFATATVQPRIVFGECKSGYIKSALFADIPGSASFLATDGWISDPLYAYPSRFDLGRLSFPECALATGATAKGVSWTALTGTRAAKCLHSKS